MRKIVLMILIITSMAGMSMSEDKTMKIELITDNGKMILTATQPVKRFKLRREARLCEGTYMTLDKNFYLEMPTPVWFTFDKNKYVSKIDYEKDPKIILNKEGRPGKDVFHKTLPKGTEFELVAVNFNAADLYSCHYWIRLVDDAEYGDKLIDAVALTGVEDHFLHTAWWSSFVDYSVRHKEYIKVNKVPMFKRSWAREVK